MSESNNNLAVEAKGFISVQQGMRGWFAVMVGDAGPMCSDDVSHRNQASAVKAGIRWAQEEGIPFVSTY